MPVDSWNVAPEEIANPQHTPHPSDRTQHIIREEFAEFHSAHARDDGRKRAYDRHELREHDRHSPVLLLEFVGANSMLLVEEKAVFPVEDPWARGATDEIAEGIAYDCREREEGSELVYIQVSARRDQSRGNKQGVAG